MVVKKSMLEQINKLFETSDDIRYVAIYDRGELFSRVRSNLGDSSAAESNKYEELLVNPAILTLAGQRGDIDCGGCRFVVVRYGNFYQFVKAMPTGHVSVCIALGADIFALSQMLYDSIVASFQKSVTAV